MRFATFSLLALATRASALTELTSCAAICITAAAYATECIFITNTTCTCTNADFQFKTQSCVTNECLAADLGIVLDFLHNLCDLDSLSITTTTTPTATVAFLPPNPAADSASGKHGNTGVIAGVVAGTVVIMLGLLGCWFVRRRRRSDTVGRSEITPFSAALGEYETTRSSFTAGAGIAWGPVLTKSSTLPVALPPLTPAQESKQPIMRWVPPVSARQLESASIEQPEPMLATQPESSSTTQLASASAPQPQSASVMQPEPVSTPQPRPAPVMQPEPASVIQSQPLPTLGELAAEVQSLRDQISGVPPPSYSTI
ncbi:hypothetical protein B0H13DRAFT_2280444 [Mycena leptocephala]|nr:hypothetical protein B0H13DRAFT_2280444 [Mycena leptocephala]